MAVSSLPGCELGPLENLAKVHDFPDSVDLIKAYYRSRLVRLCSEVSFQHDFRDIAFEAEACEKVGIGLRVQQAHKVVTVDALSQNLVYVPCRVA